MRNYFILFLIICGHFNVLSAQSAQWKKCESCNNPVVFYKELASDKDFQIQTTFVVNKNIQVVLDYLVEVSSYCNWVFNCKSVEEIEKIENNTGIYRSIIGAPWPLKDSEVFMQYNLKTIISGKEYKFLQKCLPEYKPRNEKYERITRYKALWIITKESESETRIVFFAETGGPKDMPQAVKYLFLCKAPHKTVENFISGISVLE